MEGESAVAVSLGGTSSFSLGRPGFVLAHLANQSFENSLLLGEEIMLFGVKDLFCFKALGGTLKFCNGFPHAVTDLLTRLFLADFDPGSCLHGNKARSGSHTLDPIENVVNDGRLVDLGLGGSVSGNVLANHGAESLVSSPVEPSLASAAHNIVRCGLKIGGKSCLHLRCVLGHTYLVLGQEVLRGRRKTSHGGHVFVFLRFSSCNCKFYETSKRSGETWASDRAVLPLPKLHTALGISA